jgi:hypothetical protein
LLCADWQFQHLTGKIIAMNLLLKLFTAIALVTFPGLEKPVTDNGSSAQPPTPPKIQAAILLDVSGSMDGLIEQAKALLWNMVITLGKAQCTDKSSPQVELALYEYGRTTNDMAKGYVKQLSPFTSDLDEVSKILFSLSTNGGDEYCGQVIYTSMDELKWDASAGNYKVIFIAGNEDFLQGDLHYTKACTKAKEKGVIVNTIYCGDYMKGLAEHWNLAGECGNGSFTNINQNAKEPDIPTPYDTTLIVLNSKINNTYIGYGTAGFANTIRQKEVDKMNFQSNNNRAAKRIEAKTQSNVYNNASWDLVDANMADSSYITKVDRKTLPDSLQNKTTGQLLQIVKEKTAERKAIQQEIINVNANRTKYIAEQKAKRALNKNEPTLESEVDKIIKEQVKRFSMKID